jgi:hypothetical protein
MAFEGEMIAGRNAVAQKLKAIQMQVRRTTASLVSGVRADLCRRARGR